MKREEEIFEAAMALASPEARAAYLGEACAGDNVLRRRAEELIRAAEDARKLVFLSTREELEEPVTVQGAPVAEAPGVQVGRYKLLQQIGEGGFGVVFMAEQETPVRRRVAFKVIKLGMDTKQVIARFEAERQALALMDHPNIAKVLDAGATETGRPYFVMELIKGVPITQFCDKNKLSTQDRLKLFMGVCQAIQHAHQKGIIHRDIKPSNILVTLEHSEPLPKVIDFGIAKAINQKLTEKTLFTNFAQLIGTPAYMSPEQAEMSTLDIDTRTDVYSLGVLLYELLTGTTPIPSQRLREAGYAELQRLIREEEPERPSTRLSTMLGGELSAVAGNRGSDPGALRKLFRSDLDWIVMKALDKDRRRRYDTPNELAADLQRHLANEAVEARPPSVAYRLQKLVRRHRVACAAGAAIAGALVLGATVSLWEAFLAKSAEKTAQEESYTAAMNNVLQAWQDGNLKRAHDLLRDYVPEKPGDLDLRGFEWRYLWRLCRDESRTEIPAELNQRAGYLATSPNHKFVAASSGKIVRFLDPGTGKTLERIPLPVTNTLTWPRISCARGATNLLAVRLEDGWVGLWDLATKSQLFTLKAHDKGPERVVLSPDGRYLATAEERALKLWPIFGLTQAPPAALWTNNLPENIGAVEFSPDGTTLVCSGDLFEVGALAVWDVSSGRKLERFKTPAVADVDALAFSPDGSLLASSGGETRIYVWDFTNRTVAFSLPGQKGVFHSVQFSADGGRLIAGGVDGTIRVWEVRTHELAGMFRHPEADPLHSVVYAPDGNSIFGATAHEIKIWNKDPSQAKDSVLETHQNWPGLDISPNGHWLITKYLTTYTNEVPATNRVKILDSVARKQSSILLPPVIQPRAGCFSPDGKIYAMGSEQGLISLWKGELCDDPKFDPEPYAVLTNEFEVGSLAFRPHEKILAVAGLSFFSSATNSASNRIAFWDLASGAKRDLFHSAAVEGEVARRASSVLFSPDGTVLIVGHDEYGGGAVRFWEINQWKLLAEFKHEEVNFGCLPCGFSIDGHWFASQSGATIMLFDVRDLRHPHLVKEWRPNPGHFWSAKFAPDSKSLVTMGDDGCIRFWSLATLKEALVLTHSEVPGNGLAFSPDGSFLASADARGTVRFWPAALSSEIPKIRGDLQLQTTK